MPPENVLYSDIVVLRDGQPVRSFTCTEAVDEVVTLAKNFIVSEKVAAIQRGDSIPDLKLARVCYSYDKRKDELDFNFQKSQLGMAPTPKNAGESQLTTT